MDYLKDIMKHLDRMSKELAQMRKIVIYQGVVDREKNERVWEDLIEASKEISRTWSGPSAVEEIRDQREKS